MAKRTSKKSYPRRSRSRSGSTSVIVSAVLGVLAAAWYVWGEDLGLPSPGSLGVPSGPVIVADGSSTPSPPPTPSAPEATPTPAPADGSLAGTATVIDADTLDIHSARIRLVGIDAPESGQKCKDANGTFVRCGSEAANALDAFINRNPVTCVSEGKDRYQRLLGKCSVRSQSIQDWLVRNGHAVAYRTYSTEYVPAELAARDAKAGIWAGEFVMPWDWRQGQRLDGEPPTKAMQDAASGAR
jgi:endonuclease YncB( thermonuclease family)